MLSGYLKVQGKSIDVNTLVEIIHTYHTAFLNKVFDDVVFIIKKQNR